MSAPGDVAVLVSGGGTILEAIIEDGVPIRVVVADRPCRGLDVARSAGIPAELVDRQKRGGFSGEFDRWRYTADVVRVLKRYRPILVAMAGFGTVLDEPVHTAFCEKILNTHPALLPDFPGWHAVADALAAGAPVTGCTVHIATLQMDAGPVLAQKSVKVRSNDTVESLHERVKGVERQLYPEVIREALDMLNRTGSLDAMCRDVRACA